MKNITAVIKAIHENLSRNERKVADYILGNIDRVPFDSVFNIAEGAGVSAATVSRFVRKIGCGSYSEFRVACAANSGGGENEFFAAMRDDDSDAELAGKVFAGNISSLQDTLSLLDISLAGRASGKLASAHKIVITGLGSSGTIGRDAAMRFSLLGLNAVCYTDPADILFHASLLTEKDVIIGISHSGRTNITVKAVELAASGRAETLGIANYKGSPLDKACGVFFCTSFRESRVKVAALSSRIAQMCIIDMLFVLTAKKVKKKIDYGGINQITENMLRRKE